MPSSRAITVTGPDGKMLVLYDPMDNPECNQVAFHESNAPNLLALGTRGTGKSTTLRWDAIGRCLAVPGFRALIIRRTMPDLRKSHLAFIDREMKLLGQPDFKHTTFEARFHNGSLIQFSHCEKMSDVLNYLSSEWDYIGFDELSTFPLEMFLQISAAARSKQGAAYKALVRACSNPLGVGAGWMKQWFIDRNVNLSEYPDYHPDDFEMQFSRLDGNKYVNKKEYEKRLRNLPEHVRKAWLLGEFVVEGAYFTDFMPKREIGGKVVPWHLTSDMPTWKGESLLSISWINVYRSIDWGYFPDPAVCHWHIILPNKRKITFKERTWTRTLAADVAADIKRQSEGMHIVESYCDPTMFIKTGTTAYSIGEIFEQNGVPLVASQNDRELYGYSIHEMLNTVVDDLPSWQILEYACPELVRTIPLLQMDPNDGRKIADGPDHWVISCAYFAMGGGPPSRDPVVNLTPRWMRPKSSRGMVR